MTLTKKTTKKTVSKSSKKATVKKVKPKQAFRTYDSAMSYIFKNTDYEKQQKLRYNVTTFDLDRMEALLKNLGNPHTKVKTVHIAGTKGKGSTATMLGKMIEANEYKVGLYTSPHVTTLHERITIDS
jgi:dihydrofolate synthase/folylpolyglutamate synthase